MATTTPTRKSFAEAVMLCVLLLFAPERFAARQAADSLVLNSTPSDTEDLRHLRVRNALWSSLGLVLISAAVGYVTGSSLSIPFCAHAKTITWLQVSGACLLTWGTLFVRGWDIQTIGGVTLTERVNSWLYRALYCFGTAVLVFSLSWATC